MGYEDHKESAGSPSIRCAVVTVSDTRTEETDKSGSIIKEKLRSHGHAIEHYSIVPDQIDRIEETLESATGSAQVVIFSGGTGISKRDTTYEIISRKLEKTLPGFGEIFRMLSYDDIGSGAILSRATAGVYRDTIVFSIPGSSGAVTLAMDALIVPELAHLVWEILRQK
ncbi:MAG: MogA/MoaB family molybdenum cofactor biosynthesis protein [Rhodothermales bacterium]|nr:MogA/MoaB family molybdenum cofactor biosynthesis protein [Rhodothermales bacterium]